MFSHLFFDSVYEVPSSSKRGALSVAALPGLGEQVTLICCKSLQQNTQFWVSKRAHRLSLH